MPAESLLLAITQVAVAIAGFSGLIAAIRTAAPEGWHPRDIWSLSWMLGASVGALVLGLLPLWLGLCTLALGAGAAGLLGDALVGTYVGSLVALLVASVSVLAVFLVLLARLAQDRP